MLTPTDPSVRMPVHLRRVAQVLVAATVSLSVASYAMHLATRATGTAPSQRSTWATR